MIQIQFEDGEVISASSIMEKLNKIKSDTYPYILIDKKLLPPYHGKESFEEQPIKAMGRR